MLSIDATRVLLGAVLLTLGRRLFWLFVGAVGFVVGMRFCEEYLHGYNDDTTIIVSIIVGVVFAVLAVAVRKIAIGAAGFLAGGYFLARLFLISGQEMFVGAHAAHLAPWIVFLIGGVIGAILMNLVFSWTLVILSALGGAALISESIHLGPQLVSVVFTALTVAGILIQSGIFRRRPREEA